MTAEKITFASQACDPAPLVFKTMLSIYRLIPTATNPETWRPLAGLFRCSGMNRTKSIRRVLLGRCLCKAIVALLFLARDGEKALILIIPQGWTVVIQV